MCVTVASVLSHLVVRPRLFYKINENKKKRKINIDLAIVASQMPGGAIHDTISHLNKSILTIMSSILHSDKRNKKGYIHKDML